MRSSEKNTISIEKSVLFQSLMLALQEVLCYNLKAVLKKTDNIVEDKAVNYTANHINYLFSEVKS